MAQFDKEIQRLQAFLNSPSNDMIETEAAVRKLEQLMRLDGWEPGSLAKRIDALEAQLKQLETSLKLLIQKVTALENPPGGAMGFGKSE